MTRDVPDKVMVTFALGHFTAPSTLIFFVASQVPSLLNHGPFVDAPPPPNVVRQPKIAPLVGCATTLPSPTGSRVTSTRAAVALVAGAPVVAGAALVTGAPAVAVAVAPLVVAGGSAEFDPHADDTTIATKTTAIAGRRKREPITSTETRVGSERAMAFAPAPQRLEGIDPRGVAVVPRDRKSPSAV